ncbi:MAG: hypothetical protein M3O50_12605 [Myxococcota bacterium]|nr:hypothetical protein [Myxococcota bacterium]
MSGETGEETLEPMLFRRQFVLGPAYVDRSPSWQRIELSKSLRLTVHPDLEVHRVSLDGKWGVLLGYALDPRRPQAGNRDILCGLLERFSTGDALFDATDGLGGRWILVVNDGTRTIAFGDAVGLRQLFHVRSPSDRAVWCASQPGAVAEVLKLEIDQVAASFMQTDGYANDENASTWFPGDRTPFSGAKLLLPNHYIDLACGTVRRHWPRENLVTLPLDEAITRCLPLLRGLMASARRRFDMSVAMTAGWDSRLVLAATREMARDMVYFTGIFWNMSAGHRDARAPCRLLSSLGLENHLIPCQRQPPPEFLEVFRRNVVTAHRAYAPVAAGMLDTRIAGRVCTKGDVAEIVKCYLRVEDSAGSSITARTLASLAEMGEHPFAIDAFDEWLADAHPFNVHVLDLFCWEQLMGSQEAMIQAECDLVQEAFSPLNCREILVTMLSVEEKYRRPPSYILFRKLIEELWPETLREPINDEAQRGAKSFVRRTIMRMDVHRLAPPSMRRLGKRLLA